MGALLSATGYQLETLTNAATSVLTWLLSSFGSIIGFMLENPALLVTFILGLVGTALVYFRNLI